MHLFKEPDPDGFGGIQMECVGGSWDLGDVGLDKIRSAGESMVCAKVSFGGSQRGVRFLKLLVDS